MQLFSFHGDELLASVRCRDLPEIDRLRGKGAETIPALLHYGGAVNHARRVGRETIGLELVLELESLPGQIRETRHDPLARQDLGEGQISMKIDLPLVRRLLWRRFGSEWRRRGHGLLVTRDVLSS